MRCIYLNKNDYCRASPLSAMNEADLYKPEEAVINEYCKKNDFRTCPRLITYQAHLNASEK